jgi:Tol biopolymer transport system component
VVVEDDKPGLAWDRVDPASVKFSPDSNHIAYAGRSNAAVGGQTTNSAVEDDVAGPAFGNVGAIQFSPDGKHLAYEAEQDGKSFVVIDGRQSQSFDAVAGESVCFTADGQLHFFADRDGSMYRVDCAPAR